MLLLMVRRYDTFTKTPFMDHASMVSWNTVANRERVLFDNCRHGLINVGGSCGNQNQR